jgi:(E)-4-hydroxy-3-methyl-but-2-enyl pyrophosphate reductase
VIDATCPFVTRVQHLAERAAKEGRDVVVAGNPDHPEMIGVVGYAPDNTYVVRDASEVAALPKLRSPLVVSQTTIKLQTFLEVAEAVRAKSDAEPQVVNTICSATRDRQDAARGLAGEVDVFYVIGGRHSSNSVKLLAVCQEQCEQSYLIETPAEINPVHLLDAKRVGVTAGASTPNWLINQVVKRLHELGEKQNLVPANS